MQSFPSIIFGEYMGFKLEPLNKTGGFIASLVKDKYLYVYIVVSLTYSLNP